METLRVDAPIAFDGELPIYYEDNHLLIIAKPPNLPAQADASGDMDVLTRMKRYIGEKYQKPGAVYLGLVHRLDRPVGGLMVLARTSKAAARLSAQVREKALGRLYLALVMGDLPPTGALTDFLRKDPARNTSAVVSADAPGAKEARLHYRRIGEREGLSLALLRLETGRSHQIRVQMSHAGFPLWGDARYGQGKSGQQIALYAGGLGLTHPTRDLCLRVFAAPPMNQVPWLGFAPQMDEARRMMEDWM